MFLSDKAFQYSVKFKNGSRVDFYRSSAETPKSLTDALKILADQYAVDYAHIKDYVAAEDQLMKEEYKLHFVLLDKDEKVCGYQLLYGNGEELMPMETLHPDVEIRFGSKHIFEVKRAVAFSGGAYPLFLRALASYINQKYPKQIPEGHAIVGYSVNNKVVKYLNGLGFSTVATKKIETWLRYPSHQLVKDYP